MEVNQKHQYLRLRCWLNVCRKNEMMYDKIQICKDHLADQF